MEGNINFIGSLSGDISGGGGGGSNVTITPTLSSGTKIADYEIDGEAGILYAPTPTSLTAQLPLSISNNVISIDLSDYATVSDLNNYATVSDLDDYQEKLTAGNYINIDSNNEISCTPPITAVWYTPEPDVQQDVLIGKFTVNEVTQNVYAPAGGGGLNYSTTEQLTDKKWIDGVSDVYQRTFVSNVTLSPNNYIILDPSMLSGDYTFFTVKNISLKYEGSTNYYGLNSIAGKSIDVALHSVQGLYAENYTSYNINSIVITCEYVKNSV